jgi:hypothetical protein
MKFTLATIALAIAAVSAQTWNDIPACAQPCILASVAKVTKCGATDYPCICMSKSPFEDPRSRVETHCYEKERTKRLELWLLA